MSNNNLWWSYDSESSSFSALPASPMLLPALAIMGLLSIFGFGRVRIGSNADKLGEFGKSEQYKKDCNRYQELRRKWIANGELCGEEYHEMVQLKHPKWNNHKHWEY
jgi:hypothetical protein